jgi:hypothetical protein
VFTNALSAMSPAGFGITSEDLVPSVDNSFYSQVTPSGPTGSPAWCGPSTDELQIITVTGCNVALSGSAKTIRFKMVDASFALQNVSISCDATAAVVQSTVMAATALSVHVAVRNLTGATGPTVSQIEIGYWGLQQQGKNWNSPVVLSSPVGVSVAVAAKQEGGYLNTVTTCTSNRLTLQTMSVWLMSGVSFSFSLSWAYKGKLVSILTIPPSMHFESSSDFTILCHSGVNYSTASINAVSGTDMSQAILSGINATTSASVFTVKRVSFCRLSRSNLLNFNLLYRAFVPYRIRVGLLSQL